MLGKPMITPAQIKNIHVLLGKLGIDDEMYRLVLGSRFRARSCKQLTRSQASALIADYRVQVGLPAHVPQVKKKALTKVKASAKVKPCAGVIHLASPAQHQLIADLVNEVVWRTRDGYALWLKHNMGLARVSTTAQASNVIQGLKQLKRRHHQGKHGNQ